MERQQKLRKLSKMRAALPYMSQRAMASMLQYAKEEEIPPATRREDIREARDAMAKIATPFGPLHQTMQVGERHVIGGSACSCPLALQCPPRHGASLGEST